MRFILALGFAVGILCALAAPAAASSRRRCHGECPPAGIEYEFSLGVAELALAGQTFSNTITPLDANHHPLPAETIAVTGRNVGALHPRALVGEVHVFLMHVPHLALGGKFGFLDGDFGKMVQTGSGAVVDPTHAGGVIFGPEARVIFARGPLELRGGLSFGYREEDFTVPNRIVHCKGGPCSASISAAQFFFEPRIAVAINLPVVSLGGYFGGDVMPTGGWIAGGFIAARLADWDKLSDVRTYSTRGLYH